MPRGKKMVRRRAVTKADIPELEPYCGSWVVIRNSDGSAIGEFFNRQTLKRFNAEEVTIKTTAQYLADLPK